MPKMFFLCFLLVGGLSLLLLAITTIGAMLPRRHVATVRLTLGKPLESVWDVVADIAGQPKWRPDLARVARLPDVEGREVWQEVYRRGPRVLTLRTEASDPPRRLIRRITDDSLPFSGAWEYLLEPTSNGCRVILSETGEIKNPIFRFLGRFVFGHTSALESYLRDLSAKFEESSVPERG